MAYVNIVNCLSIDWEEDKEVKKEVIEAKKKNTLREKYWETKTCLNMFKIKYFVSLWNKLKCKNWWYESLACIISNHHQQAVHVIKY